MIKYLVCSLAICAAAVASDPVPPVPVPGADWETIANALRKQRDTISQQLEDTQLQLQLMQADLVAARKDLAAEKKRNDELTKQLPGKAAPKPAK